MIDQRLKQEIARALDFMYHATDSWHDFAVGKLTALLWAQSRGELSPATCYRRALDAWDNLRKEGL